MKKCNRNRLKELKILGDIAREQKQWYLCTKYHLEEMEIYSRSTNTSFKVIGVCMVILFCIKIVILIAHYIK